MADEKTACLPTSKHHSSSHQKKSENYDKNHLPDILFKPVREYELKDYKKHPLCPGVGVNNTISYRRKNCNSLLQHNQYDLLRQRQSYSTRNSIQKTLTVAHSPKFEKEKDVPNSDSKTSPLAFEVTSYNSIYKTKPTKGTDDKKRESAKLTTLKMLWKQKEFVDQQIHILQVQKTKLNEQIQKASVKLITDN